MAKAKSTTKTTGAATSDSDSNSEESGQARDLVALYATWHLK
jgi:hypothetical protein